LETLIENYKTKLGFYPPSDPANPATNALYFELVGTTLSNATYFANDGIANLPEPSVVRAFGLSISGFMNCSKGGGGDESQGAVKFLRNLKAGQFQIVTAGNGILVPVLGSILEGPLLLRNATTGSKINPWRYNSAAPVHNANSFDLWIDVNIGNKTYRICNWSKEPIVVVAPYAYR